MSETVANANWYVRNKGKVFGPFTPEQLAAMKRSSRLTAATEVSVDRKQWSKAESVPGLFPAPKQATPMADGSGDSIAVLAGKAHEPPAPPPSPQDAYAWYYGEGEERRGPVSYSELRQLALEGKVLRETLVWNETLKDWSPAASVTDLRLLDVPLETGAPAAKTKPAGRRPSLDDTNNSGFGLSGSDRATETYGVLEPFVQFFQELVAVAIYIVSAQMLKKKAVRWVIGFGLFPLALVYARSEFRLESWITMSLLGAYFALFWAAFFHAILRPTGPVWNRGVLWAILVVLIGMPLLLASQELSVRQTLLKKALESPKVLDRFVGFTFGVGLPEEFVKVLPFFLFALSRKQRIEAKSGLFWGLSCGFGFAIAEAVMQYNKIHASQFFKSSVQIADLARSVGPGDPASSATLTEILFQVYSGTLVGQITRFISLPLLHAAWSGINGWFIASASRDANNVLPAVIVGLLLTALLHGTYDTFASSASIGGRAIGMASAVVSLLLFLAYMSKALDEGAAQGESDDV
ncbi:MAG: hypothetical protein JWN86_785 [Planctomycetota bacterium]|nr:hypothetical protein [Planctomycetota bacterium]